MARTRYLKPEFFSNEQLADLDPLTRLLFAGLWCYADREGRLEDRPRRIQIEILPYDAGLDVNQMLTELANTNFISRYEVNGARYIQIANFVRHQHPHPNEPASNYPPPKAKIIAPDNGGSSSDNATSPSDNVIVSKALNPNPKSYSNSKFSPHTHSSSAREDAREPASAGVCVRGSGGSSYSLEECRKYADSLPDIRNPAGFAKTIQRSGSDDPAIKVFFDRGGRSESQEERNARIFRRISERRAHRDN